MADSTGRPDGERGGLNRRGFLAQGLGAGAALAAVTLVGDARADTPGNGPPPNAPQRPPAAPCGTVAPGAAPPSDEFELAEATIEELQTRMIHGRTTSKRLVELYLERIAALDAAGPRVNSVIEINPEALAIAEALDAERKSKGVRGPLHGVPLLIKDNIDTADRMKTTAGSLALLEARPARDGAVAARLREAGAVLLGKTNLSEWANFRSPRSSSGWSGRGGQTRNPYALDRTPCGSSSGSAAAVAANFCAAGIGTETDGSIVCPSSINGVVGLKPTVGLVSRAGIVPISATQDTAGPMCRTVADAAILLGAIAGVDPRDPATAAARGKVPGDYRPFLKDASLKGARIGVARKLVAAGAQVDAIFEEALAALATEGATLVDPAEIPNVGAYDGDELEVMLYEFKTGLEEYLAGLEEAPVRTLDAIIRFNEERKAEEMPYFGQELFLEARKRGPQSIPAYHEALAKCRKLSRAQGIDAALKRRRVDAIVAPTGGPAWTIDWIAGDHFGGSSSTPAAVAGYPSVTVPAGYVFGLPVGLSFIGPAFSEPLLLQLAFAFERATKARRPPRFLPTASA